MSAPPSTTSATVSASGSSASAAPGTPGEIARLHRPTREVFEREHLRPQVPCVITGLMDDWAAVERWTDDYLRERVGERRVTVTRSSGRERLFLDEEAAREEMTFAEFLDRDHGPDADPKYFLMQRSMNEGLAPLLEDVSAPPLFDESRLFLVNFWYSPGTNKTPLHCDFVSNLLCMVRGRKHVLLFPPNAKVYPHPYKANFSRVDVERPDLERFPRFTRDGSLELDLAPGEMLFIPGLWWHQVHSEANVAVNWWWWPRGLDLVRTLLSRQVISFAARHARDKALAKLLGRKRREGVGV